MEDGAIPFYKTSAIRGGLGEMLLRANCIRDRNCDVCDFEEECPVRRIMYSKFFVPNKYSGTGDSVGYIIDCDDFRKEVYKGDTMTFSLTLFGRNIVYFSQYLSSLQMLGNYGFGKERVRFRILFVKNSKKADILCNHAVHMKNYEVMNLADYVDYRMEEFANRLHMNEPIIMKFKSALNVKTMGRELDDFEIRPILEGLARRLYIMNCFEGTEHEEVRLEEADLPKLHTLERRAEHIPRFSNRKQQKMYFNGISGRAKLEEVDLQTLKLLLAGEILHVGKNTSFGFGQYRLGSK